MNPTKTLVISFKTFCIIELYIIINPSPKPDYIMLISWQKLAKMSYLKKFKKYIWKKYMIVTIYEKAVLKYESWKLFYKIIFTYRVTFFG